MHSVGSAQTVEGSEPPGMTLDRPAQLHRPNGGPVLLEGPLSGGDVGGLEIVVAQRSGESRPHLGVSKSAGDRSVAAIPQLRREIAPVLFDDELHECARIEVHERHESAALFAHKIGHRTSSSWTAARHRRWSVPLYGAPDHSLARETLKLGSGADSEQPNHWQTALGDDDLLALLGSVEPRAQIGSQLANGDFHGLNCTAWQYLIVRRQPPGGTGSHRGLSRYDPRW